MEITKLTNAKFKTPKGIAICNGYTLKTSNGYVAFKCDEGLPYMPLGGHRALQAILDAGGFIEFDPLMEVVKSIN
jgi:hypothetical protein